MEPLSTPSRAMTRVRSEEPYSTPVKSFEPRSRELTPTIYGGSLCTQADSSWLRSLEQQVLDRLRKDAYLLSTLKRSMQKDMEEQLQLARRELEVFFARELRALRDSTATTVEVQAIAAEMKTLQRGSNGSENLAEAVAKLCGELDHITKESVTQTSLQASMRNLRAEVEETLRKHQGLPEEDRIRRDQQLADLQDMQDQLKELKSQQDRWEVSHRQCEEDCAQNFGFLKEELAQHRQQMKNDRQIYRQDLKKGLSSINDKVEALRFDLDATSEKLSKSPAREDTKLPHAFRHELAILSNDLSELKRQVKQQSLDLLKRRDDKDDLVEGALGLRLANIEEQVLTIKPQLTQISQLREHVVKLSNTWQQQGEASSVAQRVAQLEGSMLELQSSRHRSSPSPTRKEEPSETLWAKQMVALSMQQEQYCEQLAIVEDKLTNLWQLTPRICELEHQQKDFWRLQEQLKSLSLNIDRLNAAPMAAPAPNLVLELSEQRQVTERRIEQLKGELLQYTTSVADVRDEMRRMIGQQGDHFLKLTGENYSGFLDRLAGLERQLHERAPESQKLKSLMEETTLNLERRLNSFERQLKEGQTRAMDTSRFEHLTDGIRRPLESRLSTLELQLRERETESPSPEPRLASMERKLREGQEEHARQLRGFEERCELLETAMSRVSGALPRLSSDIMRDWEALANERFAEAKVTQELQRVAQRIETLPESMERCEQELALYRTRLDSLPEVATAQQLQRLNEDLGALKTRLASFPDRGAERLCSLEEAMKSISWELKELATQFGNVAQMQSQMQNLDGQMEIVTGLIHRMDAMGRFLQHVQDGMRCET